MGYFYQLSILKKQPLLFPPLLNFLTLNNPHYLQTNKMSPISESFNKKKLFVKDENQQNQISKYVISLEVSSFYERERKILIIEFAIQTLFWFLFR